MPLSIAQYRKKPITSHDNATRKKYVSDMKRLNGSKMKKGVKVLINYRGKNIEGTILEDLKPVNTSLMIRFRGKDMRKDIATIYGIGGKPEEAKPPEKLVKLSKQGQPSTPRALRLARPKTPPKTPRRPAEALPPKKKPKKSSNYN